MSDPMAVSAEFRSSHQAHGFPWCDTCREPAVWKESAGPLHATDQHPYGVPEAIDTSGHEVTMREWNEADTDWATGYPPADDESVSDPACRCGHPRGEHKQGEADGCLHGWGVPGAAGCFCARFDFPAATVTNEGEGEPK